MHFELQNLYKTYTHKKLTPETALEIASDFALDLINVFGDNLDDTTKLQSGWRTFAPFEFLLSLNNMLAKFKSQGYDALDDTERRLLADPAVLLGGLVRAGLQAHPDAFPGEDHFQIPDTVAHDLLIFSESK